MPDVKMLVEKLGIEKAAQILEIREDKILAEKLDPYRHGFEPEHWKKADELLKNKQEILVLGGNRAGKTEWMAKRVIQTLINKDNAMVWCLHTTQKSSIQMQQNVVWKYMPPELKNCKKTKVTNIAYSQKNGFSEESFILPNGSQCVFMNYAQKRDVIEGGECDLIWCDELVPMDWVETLRYRIVTRRGKLAITFTPISGYSQVVKDFVAGCTFKEWLPATILDPNVSYVGGVPKGHMPFVAHAHRNNASVLWFHSQLNPYNPFDELVKTLDGKNLYEKKIRAYGWADNTVGNQFPRFSDTHIIDSKDVPAEGTNYMVVDPAGARNWFMIWARKGNDGNLYVYREFPDISYGEWALPSEKPDGKEGMAQRNGAGMGIDDYKKLIRTLEGDEEIMERYIDPRAGATQAVGRDGGTSIIELLDGGEEPMYFSPAAGIGIDQGVAMINDLIAWNQQEPLSPINQPKLFVTKDCQNLIYCLKEWTGADGDKGPTKDPIDCLRYLVVMQPEYIDINQMPNNKPFSY
jgi:phage terminase large subunit-like protein